MENKPIKILAIDDSSDNLVTIKALLKESFPEALVFTAMTGLRGIELAVAEDPDVILLDIVMPTMDGYEVCKRIKTTERTHDISVVFVTAIQDDPQSRILALQSGGDGFLAKPIDESELIATVRAMIIVKAGIREKNSENERLQKLVHKQTGELSNLVEKTLGLYHDLEQKTQIQLQQQAGLDAARKQYDMLLKASLDSPKGMIIFAIDTHYQYFFFNQTHQESMKSVYHQEISPGMNLLEAITVPADRANAKRNFDLAMTGVSHSTIQTFGDVVLRYYESSYHPIYDEQQTIIGVTMFSKDVTDRMDAERQLNESNEKLDLALQSSGMGAWKFDIKTNLRSFDPQTCSLLGIDALTFGGTFAEFFAVIHPEDREIVKRALKRTIERNEPYEPEYRIIRPDGTIRYISTRGKLLLDSQETPQMMTGFLWDDTDKKCRQTELQEAKERFEKMFSTSPDTAIITRLSDGAVIEVNEGFTKTSGHSRAEVVGKSSLGLNLYHDPADRQAIVDELRKYGFMKNRETTFRRKDGSLFTGLMSATIIQIDGIPHVSSNIRDITTFKAVENALRESNEKFQLLYSSMSQGLALHEIITDEENRPVDYRFLSMNASFERLMGFKAEEIIGKTILEVLPDTEAFWIQSYGRVALTGTPERFENYAAALGRYFSVTAYCPKPGQFAVLAEDITDRKRKEEKILYINDHDFLTDLYNRRHYVDAFETLNTPDGLPLGIMMFDVNGLKIINDAYGHDVGDRALRAVADVLKEVFESKDVVARIGGDEFAILLPNTSLEKLLGYKETLKLSIANKPIMNVHLSLAIGFELMTESSRTLDEILKLAENHMYRHKLAEGVGVRNRAIQAILSTLTEKYEPERIHSERVSIYCKKIGEVLPLPQDDLNELAMAGMFHDIGKISIADAILEKPGKLTALEFETIKTHTEIGYQILRAADQYSDLAVHALSHHERWDGKGYPRGLKGEQIPLYSRIIGVADAFEAMTAERPYKEAFTIDKAIVELKRCAGTQFDPGIVTAFVEHVLLKQRN